MNKRKALIFVSLFLIAVFALPVSVHAAWKTMSSEKQTVGNSTIWIDYNAIHIKNNRTGTLRTLNYNYSAQAITNGKTMYCTNRYGKTGGYIDYYKYDLASGKITRLFRIKDGTYVGNILIAYRNGYLYFDSSKITGYKRGYSVLRRIKISTKKISIVKSHFSGTSWNGKETITGYLELGGRYTKTKVKI